MPDLAIIADDLTGALDAAAPFAMRGISTVVALSPAALPEALARGARIVSVSTDSREIAPAAARSAVQMAVEALPAGVPIFKKVDSRLKGNIAAELDAIPHRQSLVAPAIPEFGRITQNGAISGFAIAEPIGIAERLGQHAGHARIPDVASQADIDLALAVPSDLLIGARGLADAMARRMAPLAKRPDVSLTAPVAYCVIGSTDPVTLAQIDHLRQTHRDMVFVSAPNGVAPSVSSSGPLTLVQATKGEKSSSGKDVALALAESLQRLQPPAAALLVLSGGATAQMLLEALGVQVLDLVGEALPGLPLAHAGDLTVVTKSGGFGQPGSLSRLLTPYT